MLRALLMLLLSFVLLSCDREAHGATLTEAAKPTMLSVFVCETVPGHYVEDMAKQGVEVMPARDWVDMDWAYDNSSGTPLKRCERQYVAIRDLSAAAQAAEQRPVPVDPDPSDYTQCAWLAMQVVGIIKSPGVIAACPRPVYDDQHHIVAYTDPPCPPDCECSNEPEDL